MALKKTKSLMQDSTAINGSTATNLNSASKLITPTKTLCLTASPALNASTSLEGSPGMLSLETGVIYLGVSTSAATPTNTPTVQQSQHAHFRTGVTSTTTLLPQQPQTGF
eukprot:9444816-Ditylum_brightwellii.AAC.1